MLNRMSQLIQGQCSFDPQSDTYVDRHPMGCMAESTTLSQCAWILLSGASSGFTMSLCGIMLNWTGVGA